MLIVNFILACCYLLQSLEEVNYANIKARKAVKFGFESAIDVADILLIILWFILDISVVNEPGNINNYEII